jgi:hypothetical protein
MVFAPKGFTSEWLLDNIHFDKSHSYNLDGSNHMVLEAISYLLGV